MSAVLTASVSPAQRSTDRAIVWWLLAVAALVYAMVVVGGVTRLTRSGLSIVEWNPIVGVVPPLGEHQWMAEFAKYQQSPEYRQVNHGMSLADFKSIFYMEWAHRLLGRLIGFVVLIPLIYFAIRKRISRELVPKILVMLVLGGLQGALGWFMVKSGLVNIPRVSQYRLTAHLCTAVLIYSYILWIAFGLLWPRRDSAAGKSLWRTSIVVTALVCLMIVAGGFVAGTKAGFAFNTFPLMAGQFVPPGIYALQPWWKNLFENIATVQFDHRMLAYVLFAVGVSYFIAAKHMPISRRVRIGLNVFVGALLLQITLGISTLLLVVPVWLGALHQAGAILVLTSALFLNHALRPRA